MKNYHDTERSPYSPERNATNPLYFSRRPSNDSNQKKKKGKWNKFFSTLADLFNSKKPRSSHPLPEEMKNPYGSLPIPPLVIPENKGSSEGYSESDHEEPVYAELEPESAESGLSNTSNSTDDHQTSYPKPLSLKTMPPAPHARSNPLDPENDSKEKKGGKPLYKILNKFLNLIPLESAELDLSSPSKNNWGMKKEIGRKSKSPSSQKFFAWQKNNQVEKTAGKKTALDSLIIYHR